MQFRLGTCSSCGAQFKVPASFQANQARCRSCSGVVEIGPVQSEDAPAAAAKPAAPVAPPVPAAKPAPKPAVAKAEPEPKKKREGPSMKEQLMARRRAEADAAPAAPAAAKPVPAKPVAPAKPAPAKAAARPAAPAKPLAKAGAKAAPAPRSGGDDEEGGSARPSRASRGGRKGGRSSSRSKRGGEKKGNPLLLVGSLLGLIVIAGAVWFVFSGEESVEAKDDETVAAADESAVEKGGSMEAAAEETSGDEPIDVDEGDRMIGSDEASADAGGDDVAAEAPDEAASDDAAADGGAAADAPKEAPKPAASDADVDLSEVDLAAIPDYGPIEGVSDEEWADLQKWAGQMIDPNAGAAGNRARTKLLEAAKAAFPAVLNEFKALDFTTDQGRKDGDLYQRLLSDICDGRNFGWKYTTDPKDALFNKKVVRSWAGQWDKAKDSEEYWEHLSKQKGLGTEEKPEESAAEKRQKALDALDDI